MDSLDRLIQLAQITGNVHSHCLFQGNWQLSHQPNADQVEGVFHILLQGQLQVTIAGEHLQLNEGDILYFPKGLAHELHNLNPQGELLPVEKTSRQPFLRLTTPTDSGQKVEMFCGSFFYTKQTTLIDALPDFIHLSMKDSPFEALVAMLKQEATQPQVAAQSIINALSKLLFTYLLRHYLSQNPEHRGILNGLQDKRLSKVISALLKSPEQPWNMDNLAELAAMSRANFIRVFQQKVGIAPGKFLIKLRMEQAAMQLSQSQNTILNIALAVGYQSESHFSKAFKLYYGIPPSVYRRNENPRPA